MRGGELERDRGLRTEQIVAQEGLRRQHRPQRLSCGPLFICIKRNRIVTAMRFPCPYYNLIPCWLLQMPTTMPGLNP